MTLSYEFVIARAEQATREADEAQLSNVRDRALRSAAAWQVMADRIVKHAEERAEALRAKQVEQSAAG
ncbi:hypothetical protein H7F50_03955 [Novosphingobium flavum]|uniref:Uncharacterized protein n=1 Tax=Novosphingobium aerophilum TaxID=2839843 RepID=A0A7X1F8H8_9SPHN|nr:MULTISPECIES: hypothetical protein [Novosphingobium]MBC2652301.1 hypothetical protein [Novosphingobium aerophilum]MBC2660895.1 hypothetical protein [Novosphingobium aerophilum]